MNLGRRADAHSKETEFAGLPKAVKLYANAFVAPGVGVFRDLPFSFQLFNYGGYTFNSTLTGIIVPEPGIYVCEAAMLTDRISSLEMLLAKNSIGVFSGNTFPGGFYVSSDNNTYITGIQAMATVELVAGDILSIQYAYGTPLNMNPCTFGITKLGGQY